MKASRSQSPKSAPAKPIAFLSDTLVPQPEQGEEYSVIQAGQSAGAAAAALDKKAAIAAEIKRRLDAAAGLPIEEDDPTTPYEIIARQNQLIQKMDTLTNTNN